MKPQNPEAALGLIIKWKLADGFTDDRKYTFFISAPIKPDLNISSPLFVIWRVCLIAYIQWKIKQNYNWQLQRSTEDLLQIINWLLLIYIKCNLLYQVDLHQIFTLTVWNEPAFLSLPQTNPLLLAFMMTFLLLTALNVTRIITQKE